ncbi:hypothetical protein EPO34_02255 [Patescibacteria group bacterium]|nr:MAG: hypothetical protein EPO34_02255 [Patescibacteria group bacterium]
MAKKMNPDGPARNGGRESTRIGIPSTVSQGEKTDLFDTFQVMLEQTTTDEKMTDEMKAETYSNLLEEAGRRRAEAGREVASVRIKMEDTKDLPLPKKTIDGLLKKQEAEMQAWLARESEYRTAAEKIRSSLLGNFARQLTSEKLLELRLLDQGHVAAVADRIIALEAEQQALAEQSEKAKKLMAKIDKEELAYAELGRRFRQLKDRADVAGLKIAQERKKLDRARKEMEAEAKEQEEERILQRAPSRLRKGTKVLKAPESDTVVDEAPRTLTESRERTVELKRPKTVVDTARDEAPVSMTEENDTLLDQGPATVDEETVGTDEDEPVHTAVSVKEERRGKKQAKGLGGWIKGLFK